MVSASVVETVCDVATGTGVVGSAAVPAMAVVPASELPAGTKAATVRDMEACRDPEELFADMVSTRSIPTHSKDKERLRSGRGPFFASRGRPERGTVE